MKEKGREKTKPILKRFSERRRGLRRKFRIWCLKKYGKEPWEVLCEIYLLAEKKKRKKKEEKMEEEKESKSPIEELF